MIIEDPDFKQAVLKGDWETVNAILNSYTYNLPYDFKVYDGSGRLIFHACRGESRSMPITFCIPLENKN